MSYYVCLMCSCTCRSLLGLGLGGWGRIQESYGHLLHLLPSVALPFLASLQPKLCIVLFIYVFYM